ncbi:unnamed protein product, partial [Nesidiocoris tenuis]
MMTDLAVACGGGSASSEFEEKHNDSRQTRICATDATVGRWSALETEKSGGRNIRATRRFFVGRTSIGRDIVSCQAVHRHMRSAAMNCGRRAAPTDRIAGAAKAGGAGSGLFPSTARAGGDADVDYSMCGIDDIRVEYPRTDICSERENIPAETADTVRLK